MRLGLIVRCDDTGIGNQTWEIWRHLHPEVTVAVDFSRLPNHLPQNRDRYPDTVTWTTWKGVGFPFDNDACLPLLKTCDVVFSVETFYDLRVPNEVEHAVLYINPELFRGYGAPIYWAPTPWLLHELPAGTRVVPFPVATDRPWQMGEGFLHVAGRNTSYDRNGTRPAAEAVRRLGSMLNMVHQVDMPSIKGARRLGAVENYWDVYSHGDVLVMPRRYGGLSLPVQEALCAGLTVVMTDTAPNDLWPVRRISSIQNTVRTVANYPIPAVDVDVVELTEALRTVNDWGREMEPARAAWVEANSWDTLAPVWMQALEDAAN